MYNGTNPEDDDIFPDLLQEVEMKVMDPNDCLSSYIAETFVDDSKSYTKAEIRQILKLQNLPAIPKRMIFCAIGKHDGGDSCRVVSKSNYIFIIILQLIIILGRFWWTICL